ncbi:MAG: endonuclease domain-containing protein [Thermodesulfobacteriota bacterium]
MKLLAKSLRRKQSEAERQLWRYIRNRQLAGFKFRRQHIIEPYIVDFICLERKLIIEIDGGQHAEHLEYDARRTAFLGRKGFRVIRFWNNEVLADTEAVLSVIRAALIERPSPQPSPLPGEREWIK